MNRFVEVGKLDRRGGAEVFVADVAATDDGDLDFQDLLAAASNLRRVLMTFRRLTIQIKLFTTVLGLRYAYSIDEPAREPAVPRQLTATAGSKTSQSSAT